MPPAPASGSGGSGGAGWFRRAKGFKRLFGAIGKTFPGSAPARMGARAARFKAIGRGLKAAGSGARMAGLGRLAGGLEAGGALAGRAGAALGASNPIGWIVMAGQATVEFGKAVHKASEETLRYQARLAYASGSMASVFAERQVRDILRDQRQGQLLAPSARDLSNANANMRDEIARFETFITLLKNKALAPLEDFFAGAINGLSADVLDALNKLLGGAPGADTTENIFRKIADDAEARRAAGDRRFAPADLRRHRP
jgi:hypothetical protein